MRAARLQDALERLTTAIRDVESELAAMKAEHDPLASLFPAGIIETLTTQRAGNAATQTSG